MLDNLPHCVLHTLLGILSDEALNNVARSCKDAAAACSLPGSLHSRKHAFKLNAPYKECVQTLGYPGTLFIEIHYTSYNTRKMHVPCFFRISDPHVPVFHRAGTQRYPIGIYADASDDHAKYPMDYAEFDKKSGYRLFVSPDTLWQIKLFVETRRTREHRALRRSLDGEFSYREPRDQYKFDQVSVGGQTFVDVLEWFPYMFRRILMHMWVDYDESCCSNKRAGELIGVFGGLGGSPWGEGCGALILPKAS